MSARRLPPSFPPPRGWLPLTLLGLLLFVRPLMAAPIERVLPGDSLADALERVDDGGVVEVAQGVYRAPTGGFRISGKSLTLRATGGGSVALDGGDTDPVLRIEDRGRGVRVVLEGLTLRNGRSQDLRRAGGLTADGGTVVVDGCRFRGNRATGSLARGGALQALRGSRVEVRSTLFDDNHAGQWGGAIYLIEGSRVRLVDGELRGNRTDLPDQGPVPAGGAVYVFDATLEVQRTRFEDNASGWLGGAIYAIGSWSSAAVGGAVVTVEDSIFVANRAIPNPCCSVLGPPGGGAIHLEDRARLLLRRSRLVDNESNWGGAITSYRSEILIFDSVFRRNRAVAVPGGAVPAGGTINMVSNDATPGAPNRRSATLIAERTLLEGFEDGTASAVQGGCVLAIGDLNRLYGEGGLAANGDAAKNRAVVELRETILSDCHSETSSEHGAALGGGLFLSLADLLLEDSLVLHSTALGANGAGGGILSFEDSRVRLVRSSLAANAAESLAGGLLMNGGEVEVADSLFLDNDVSPGFAEPLANSNGGSAIRFSSREVGGAPHKNLEMRGAVRGTSFVGNSGIAIVDVDLDPPRNTVRYDRNRFARTGFEGRVYKNLLLGFGGYSPAELNALVVAHSDGTTTRKSEEANVQLFADPVLGQLVAAPSRLVPSVDAGGQSAASLGLVWSGRGASLDGAPLADRTGVVEVTRTGTSVLRVDGSLVATAAVRETGCGGEDVLCLNDDRFTVEVDWRSATASGRGRVVPAGSADSGLFWFFDEDNWEMLVKVLDGCATNDRFWVFAAVTSDVGFTLRVTDLETGAAQVYDNPLGTAPVAITDTSALAVCR